MRSLVNYLWQSIGMGKKPKPAFATEQEAYEFCQKVYRDNNGVSPELRRAYEFYKKNYNDDCGREPGYRAS